MIEPTAAANIDETLAQLREATRQIFQLTANIRRNHAIEATVLQLASLSIATTACVAATTLLETHANLIRAVQ